MPIKGPRGRLKRWDKESMNEWEGGRHHCQKYPAWKHHEVGYPSYSML